jgi:hypothetical protein
MVNSINIGFALGVRDVVGLRVLAGCSNHEQAASKRHGCSEIAGRANIGAGEFRELRRFTILELVQVNYSGTVSRTGSVAIRADCDDPRVQIEA